MAFPDLSDFELKHLRHFSCPQHGFLSDFSFKKFIQRS